MVFIYKDVSLIKNNKFMKLASTSKNIKKTYSDYIKSIDFHKYPNIGLPVQIIKPKIVDYESNNKLIFSEKNSINSNNVLIGLHEKGISIFTIHRETLYFIPWSIYFSSLLIEENSSITKIILPNGKNFTITTSNSYYIFNSLYRLLPEKMGELSEELEIFYKQQLNNFNNNYIFETTEKKNKTSVKPILYIMGLTTAISALFILWYTPEVVPSSRTPESYALLLEDEVQNKYRQQISLGDIKEAAKIYDVKADDKLLESIFTQEMLSHLIKDNNKANITFDSIQYNGTNADIYFKIKRKDYSSLMFTSLVASKDNIKSAINSNQALSLLEELQKDSEQYIRVSLEKCGILWCLNESNSDYSPSLYSLNIYKYFDKALGGKYSQDFIENTARYKILSDYQYEYIEGTNG